MLNWLFNFPAFTGPPTGENVIIISHGSEVNLLVGSRQSHGKSPKIEFFLPVRRSDSDSSKHQGK